MNLLLLTTLSLTSLTSLAHTSAIPTPDAYRTLATLNNDKTFSSCGQMCMGEDSCLSECTKCDIEKSVCVSGE